jgi:hypothetical protein
MPRNVRQQQLGRAGWRLIHHEVADARQHFHRIGTAHELGGAVCGILADRGILVG